MNPTTTTKLRLMCSYGGHIVPRPRTNTLSYIGGDTKLISLNPHTTTTLSSLTSLLSSALSIPFPFTLKYLLPPHHDFSSLIPISSDPDLLLFLHHLLALSSSPSSPRPSRIRLFLFPDSVIHNPKNEVWFSDTLKSAKIMHKVAAGGEGDAQSESLSGGDVSSGGVSMAESMVLETSSSFGSMSSSASLSNLAAVKARVEDGEGSSPDYKAKLPPLKSIPSDNSITSVISQPQTGTYQDSVVHVSSMENSVSYKPLESEIKIPDSSSGIQAHKPILASGYPLSLPLNQLQQQQVQFVPVGAQYIPNIPAGALPISSYYQIYPAQPPQLLHYQPNHLCPVYFVPVGQMPHYNLPVQCGLVNTATTPNQPPVHLKASLTHSPVGYKEAIVAPSTHDLASQVYGSGHAHVAMPLVHVTYNENQQQPMGPSQMHHQPQSIAIASRESANYSNGLDDDPARVQIYKSQPPAPSVPSQYQIMTKATTILLSDALAQLHTDNLKQHSRTSLPQ